MQVKKKKKKKTREDSRTPAISVNISEIQLNIFGHFRDETSEDTRRFKAHLQFSIPYYQAKNVL